MSEIRSAWNRWVHDPTEENRTIFLDACERHGINPITWEVGSPQ